MTRIRRHCVPLVIALIAAAASERPSDAQGGDPRCPVDVVGIWKPEITTESSPVFLSFAPDGWVSLLGGSAETRAQDFEVIAQVGYRVDGSSKPARVEFRAARGNDVFPPGASSWEIVHHDDDSFGVLNSQSGETSRWMRVQTHRYFLTFAVRTGTSDREGPELAMLTKLDGRRTDYEAMGVRRASTNGGGGAAVFGTIPAALARQFAVEQDNKLGLMLRVELNEAEYHRTHAVFEGWRQRLNERTLPADDPYRRLMQFFEALTARLNQCGEKLELTRSAEAPSAAAAGGRDSRERPAEFIRRLRTVNDLQHVADDRFPFVWEPPPPM